jgi:putative FmdB family regulatory protein
MPMYDYRCNNCDEKFEELVLSSSTPDEEIVCPNCNENQSERLLSAPMVSTSGLSSSTVASSSRGCGHTGFS